MAQQAIPRPTPRPRPKLAPAPTPSDEALAMLAELRTLAARASRLNAAQPGPAGRMAGFVDSVLGAVVTMLDAADADPEAILRTSRHDGPDTLLLSLYRPSPERLEAMRAELAAAGVVL